ncbi:unnamed protein product [Closterium sp. NIES-64]|nr:unnamed protein product [Closterium sp. NIES-64]
MARDPTDLLPGLPDDVASLCLARLPFFSHLPASAVCRSWRAFFSSPLPWSLRAAHAIRHGDLLLLCTGLWTSSAGEPALVFHVWDPQLDAWMRLPPLFAGRAYAPHAFEGFCCTAVGASVAAAPIAAGMKGLAAGGSSAAVGAAGTPIAVVTAARAAPRASARGGAAGARTAPQPARPSLFVLGGEYRFSPRLGGTSSLAERMPHVWCLDLGSGRWQQLADMSRCRVNLNAAVVLPAPAAAASSLGTSGRSANTDSASGCGGGGGGGCRLLALGGSSDPVGSYATTPRGDGRLEGLRGSEDRWMSGGDAELDGEGRMWVGEALSLDNVLSCDVAGSAVETTGRASAGDCAGIAAGIGVGAAAMACGSFLGEFDQAGHSGEWNGYGLHAAAAATAPDGGRNSSGGGGGGGSSSSSDSSTRSTAGNAPAAPVHATWRRFARMPAGFDPSSRLSATAVLGGHLFVFSRSSHDDAGRIERLDLYDLATDEWMQVGLIRGPTEGWCRGAVAAVDGVGLLCVSAERRRLGLGEVDVAWLNVDSREWVVVAQVPVARELGWAGAVSACHVAAAGRRVFVVTEGALVQRVGFCMKKVKPVNGMHVLKISWGGSGSGGGGGGGGGCGGMGGGVREKDWKLTWEVSNMELASAVVGCAALHI